MKRILIGLFVASLTLPALADRRVIILAGHIPGGKTDLTLANPSSQPQDVTLAFHPGAGGEWRRTISLPAGGSVLLVDALDPAGFGSGLPDFWLGELEVLSSFRVDASARIYTESASGTFGSTWDSYDADALPSGGVITGLLSNDRFRSNVAFANASDDPAAIHFEIRREDGTGAGASDFTIPPHASIQRSIREFFSTSGDDPISLAWSADRPAIAAGAVIDARSSDPTNAPSVESAGRSLLFPSVGKFPGAAGTFWTTSLALSSVSDDEDDVELELHGSDGHSTHASLTIPPRGSFRSEDLFSLFGLSGGSGVLELIATQPTVASARLFNTAPDGATSGLTVLPQSPDDGSMHTRIFGVRRDSRFRLNVSITNAGDSDADGTIRLDDASGHEVESRRFAVPAMSTAQFAMVQTQVEVEAGEVEVEVEHGSAVTAAAAMVDNTSGDGTVRAGEDAHQHEQEIEFAFAPAAPVAGDTVHFTASAGSSGATFTWDFGDGGLGAGADASHTFAASGEYLVTLTAVFPGGAIVHKAEDLFIGGGGASSGGGATGIDFSWSPTTFAPGQLVTFTATIAGTPAAGASIRWSFPGGVHASGNPATFTFASSEAESVEVELEQEGHVTLSATHVVTPGGGSPTGGGGFATAVDFTWDPAAVVVGEPVSFTATFTGTPAAGAIVRWSFPGGVHATGNPAIFTFS